MRRIFAFPLASAVGLLAMGSIAASLSPQADMQSTQSVSVNRALKGDRLSVTVVLRNAQRTRDTSSERPAVQPNVKRDAPVGCDPLFSPISAPVLAHLFRRCLT